MSSKQHLGHHLGPAIDAPSYEDADIRMVALRLDEAEVPRNREGCHD